MINFSRKPLARRLKALTSTTATATVATTTAAAVTAVITLGGIVMQAPVAQAAPAPAITWENCPEQVDVEGAQCGRISVPTYYSKPELGSISVGFVKVPAANPAARRGALFTNPGGPGGDAYAYAGSEQLMWPDAIRAEWDIIGVQPRGLKGSTPVDCVTHESGDLVKAMTQSGAYMRESCEKATPGYTRSLTTENTARDWDMVRWALGEEKISILGLSYGTFLGSTYATMFPQRTDRLVLDSAMSQSLAWNGILESQKAGYRMAYNDFFAYVARNDARFHLGTTPLKVYERWSAKVQREAGMRPTVVPPNAQVGDLPQGLEIAGKTGADALTATGELRVQAEAIRDRILNPNASQALSPTYGLTRTFVPTPVKWDELAAHIAGHKDLTDDLPLTSMTTEEQEAVTIDAINAQSMQNLILCNENTVPGNPMYVPSMLWAQFVTADPAVVITEAYASGAACNGMPPVTRPRALSGAGLAVRPLQISATRDPQTPYRYHGDLARAMGAHVVTVHGPGHGHVALGNKAVDDTVVEYLRHGRTSVTDLPGLR